jgi:hypothetical protein
MGKGLPGKGHTKKHTKAKGSQVLEGVQDLWLGNMMKGTMVISN